MIVGVYKKDGSCLVGPLDTIAARTGKREYDIKQMLEGKHVMPKDWQACVKLPNNAVWRL